MPKPVAPEQAHAKINLTLHVTGRRPDGYHTLDSLVVFAGAADVLTGEAADTLSLEIDGPFANTLRGEDPGCNLVLRAACALAAHAGTRAGAALRLDKRLPVASGIGGGSADAAAAIRLLGALWDAPVPPLPDLVSLGADVPACLLSRPAVMRGVGEELVPAPRLPSVELLLVNPLVPVSTVAVFRAREGGFRPAAALPEAWATATDMARDLARLGNDLEAPACVIAPPIRTVLEAIASRPSCLLARMSGSGGTCFGLFEPGPHAAQAHGDLARTGWWVWHGGLLT